MTTRTRLQYEGGALPWLRRAIIWALGSCWSVEVWQQMTLPKKIMMYGQMEYLEGPGSPGSVTRDACGRGDIEVSVGTSKALQFQGKPSVASEPQASRSDPAPRHLPEGSTRVTGVQKDHVSGPLKLSQYWQRGYVPKRQSGDDQRSSQASRARVSKLVLSVRWMQTAALLSAALMTGTAEAKFVEGLLKTPEKWAFLTRFCFLSHDGTFAFDVEYNMEYATEKLLLYYDSPDQWPAVYKKFKGLELHYKITMTNGYSFWYKHFSADEFYILQTNLAALALQTGIIFLSLLAAAELKKRQLFHTTYRLYMMSLVAQVFGLLFLSLHYARYGYDGVGLRTSKLLGRVLQTASVVMMVLMLLLMAKGFNITRGRLRQSSAVRLTVFMCLYLTTYVTLFIYEQQVFDPGQVLYIYESPAGYGLTVLRLLAWCMFLYASFFTMKHYPEKTAFYCPFFIFYSLWFLAGPIVIIISNHVIDKWVREKVVNGVELTVTLTGHIFFLILTRPSAANSNFPYHVRTSQITALEDSSSGVVGNNTLDAFAAHRYAPDLPQPKTHTSPDLFLVSGAVEMRPLPGPKSILKEDKSFPHHPPGAPPVVFQEDSISP
ncbi:transmembrane protein 145-like isoform X2 [Panulirus ornatus]|uniref:transmembrane protein 145-like isoform X2 n=1 Tax=Panulirus ornatus TaxID=150431 RepID=UPI003A8B5890